MRGPRATADRFLHAYTTTMVSASRADEQRPRVELERPMPGALHVQLFGAWRIGEPVPAAAAIREELTKSSTLDFDTSHVVAWDSVLVSYAARVVEMARSEEVAVDRSGLPSGVQRLLALAEATPRKVAAPAPKRPPWLARLGTRGIERGRGLVEIVGWLGELTIAVARLLIGRAKFRASDLFLHMQLTGARALGIVSLVAALVGLILAYVGAVQLEQFGAAIYVADLVGIAIVRDMGAMMAAIVVAGRTGAAFAAELGTMRVTQEIDALSTLSIRPVEFLVLPRVLAVTLMMPLLCVFADVVGLAGGAVVGIAALHIPPRLYLDQTLGALSIEDFLGGIVKAGVYGFLIGAAACYEGLRSGRTAAAVGKAATTAVVDGIVLVIAACGLFAVVFHRLGI